MTRANPPGGTAAKAASGKDESFPKIRLASDFLDAAALPAGCDIRAAESVDELIEKEGLKQISDSSAIEAVIDEVLANNAKMVEEFKAGKQKAFNALVGQAMKATRGKANPKQVNEILTKKLNG